MPDRTAAAQRRQLVPFAALSATYFAHIGFFNPYLALWLKHLGFGIVAISLLGSLQAATRLFAPFAWGALSDRTGERVKLLRWGASTALLGSMGLWFDFGVLWLCLVLVVMFTHTSSMMSMSEAAMAHLVSSGGSFDARRYGRVRLWGSLGFLVTVFAAGAWFERFGMDHFPAWTMLTLLGVVASAWCLPNIKEDTQIKAGVQALPLAAVLRQAPVRWLFASAFLHVLAQMGIYVFFSLYLDSLGYSKTMIGVLWAVSVVAEVGWFFSQSRWLPVCSLTAWLVVCAVVSVLRMGLTAGGAELLPVLMLAQLLQAITFAAHHSVCIALMSHHFPGHLRGRGQALYTVAAYGLPGVLAGVAGGALANLLGLRSIFVAATAISLTATACAFRVWRLQHPAISARG